MGSLLTSLISPLNNNFTKLNYTDFSCGAETETDYSLKNITFYLWNSTELVYNETKNISGTLNTTGFNYTFAYESNYLWNCLSWNNNSNSSLAENYSITYDITKPNVSLVEPFPIDETSSSTSKIFYYNVSDNFNISKCDLVLNNGIVAGNSSAIANVNNITYTLTPGTYLWQINCADMAGNQENSSSRSITITAPAVQISSSGGGGGSSTVQTYTLTKEQASSGYTKELGKSEKIIFTIFDEKTEQHELTLDYVGSNFVNLTLRSAPIRIVLGIGQSIKLNLTSSQYYDLYIKLDEIVNNKAKLTIQTIHENILTERETAGKEETGKNEEAGETPIKEIDYTDFKKMWQAYSGVYIAVIFGVIIVGYLLLKSFKKSIKLKIEFKLRK